MRGTCAPTTARRGDGVVAEDLREPERGVAAVVRRLGRLDDRVDRTVGEIAAEHPDAHCAPLPVLRRCRTGRHAYHFCTNRERRSSLERMLLDGINHIGMLTSDTDRLHAFYREVFDVEVFSDEQIPDGPRLSFITIGPKTHLNVFEVEGNTEAQRQTPMFGRGRLDHVGLEAASQEAFDTIRDRLIERGATDGFVTDFGAAISLFFVDPDGLEGEVLLYNPAAGPDDLKPPGTPAAGYERVR